MADSKPVPPAANATQRDRFALAAMESLIGSDLPFRKWRWARPNACDHQERDDPTLRALESEAIARIAYDMADAMLAERVRTPGAK